MKTSLYKALYGGLFAGLLLATASTARAELKKFAFQGTVSTVFNFFGVPLDSSITNGAPVEGYYTFNTDAPDASGDPTVGIYFFTDSQSGLVVKFGSQVVRSRFPNPNLLLSVTDRESDHYQVISYDNMSDPAHLPAVINWQLDDFTGTYFTNDALPSTPPDLSVLSSWDMQISDMFGLYYVGATITSIQEVPADSPPVPAVTIEKAFEVKWTSILGYFYQVQRRLKHPSTAPWTDLGMPVIGFGGEQSEFVLKGENEYNYRVVLVN